jgi:endonuclease G
VLPYHHFSVVMNRARRQAFFTAVNIDGANAVSIEREDQWFFDPRIPRAAQAGNEVYEYNPLDRGHLVRRLDPAWGASEQIAKVANDDTFHWTNCSPQHQSFNRLKTRWAGIEDYVRDTAIAHDLKVTVFTGPVFRSDDPVYRDMQLPQQFWKVVVMVKENGGLSATAYLLSQAQLIDTLVEEEFAYGAHRTFQVPIGTVEEITGLSFRGLSNFDPASSHEAFALETAGYAEIRSFEDISV